MRWPVAIVVSVGIICLCACLFGIGYRDVTQELDCRKHCIELGYEWGEIQRVKIGDGWHVSYDQQCRCINDLSSSIR